MNDISEVKTTSEFQKRIASTVASRTVIYEDLGTYDFEITGRPLKIQISNSGITKLHVNQFTKAMKAQFLSYDGKSSFNVASQVNGRVITVAMQNVKKSDLPQIENMLLTLL
jgi:hypothetical protein